jgi:hypothetical protein
MIQKPKCHGVAPPTPFESILFNQPLTIQDSALAIRLLILDFGPDDPTVPRASGYAVQWEKLIAASAN